MESRGLTLPREVGEFLRGHQNRRRNVASISRFLQSGGGAFKCSLIRLGVDPYRIRAAVTQQAGHGREIDRLDQASRCVVAKPVGVDMGHIRTPAEHRQ
jgi:hypothetical protein